ncbi:MAG: OmpA family protein [Deltaproteobacteria bacterium]|nr:OmpA family protein [Deltaproteobacteria bacterium]
MRTPARLVLVTVALTCGCVTKAAHDDLQRQLDGTESALRAEQEADRQAHAEQLSRAEHDVDSLTAGLDQSKVAAAEYQRQLSLVEALLAEKETALAQLEQRQQQTERDLAAVLEKRSALKASLEQMSVALEELRKHKTAADRRVADYQAMLDRFAALIDAGKLKVSIVDGRMVLTLPMDILFASGRATLTDEGTSSLKEVGKGLSTIPGRRFQVEGHTDDVPINTAKFPSNWELGAGRALVVLRALEEGGVPPQQLSAATYGEYRPAHDNDGNAHRAANRRIEIVIVPDLSTLPGYEELNALGGG